MFDKMTDTPPQETVPKTAIKIAMITMNSRDQKQANIDQATSLIKKAANLGANWILLPEMFTYMGDYRNLAVLAEKDESPLLNHLATLCRHHNICLFAGSVPEFPDGHFQGESRVYNTLYVLDRNGNLVAKYRKCHLFNLIDSDGRKLYCESDGFLAGDHPGVIEIEGFRVGLAICYDLRFSEYFVTLSAQVPLDLLMVPAAFTYETGAAHWELLLRSRAIEQQCFVAAANQYGEHAPGKACYGHSMFIDPWGVKAVDGGEEPGVILGTLKKETIIAVRQRLPLRTNKRPELYGKS